MRLIYPPVEYLKKNDPEYPLLSEACAFFNHFLGKEENWKFFINQSINEHKIDLILINNTLGIQLVNVANKKNEIEEKTKNLITAKHDIFDSYMPTIKSELGSQAFGTIGLTIFSDKWNFDDLSHEQQKSIGLLSLKDYDSYIDKKKYKRLNKLRGKITHLRGERDILKQILGKSISESSKEKKNLEKINLIKLPKAEKKFSEFSKDVLPFLKINKSKFPLLNHHNSLEAWIRNDYEIEDKAPLELNKKQIALSFNDEPALGKVSKKGFRRIVGPAGSGKSIVLAAKARYLEQKKKKVLILFYNKTLKSYLQQFYLRAAPLVKSYLEGKGKPYDKYISENKRVFHFHAFCKYFLEKNGYIDEWNNLWPRKKDPKGRKKFFEQKNRALLKYIAEITNDFKSLNLEIRTLLQPYRLDDFSLDELKEIDDKDLTEANRTYIFDKNVPILMLKIIKILKHKKQFDENKYDSILVDEAQDFPRDWLEVILEFLEDKPHSEIYLAEDKTQDIYKRKTLARRITSLGFSANPSRLEESYRLPNLFIPHIENFINTFFTDEEEINIPEIPKISSPDLIDDSAKCIMEWHQVSPENGEDFLINLIKNYAVNLDNFSYPSLSVIMNKIETGENIAFKLRESFKSEGRRGRLVKDTSNVVSAFDDASKLNFHLNQAPIKLSPIHSFKGMEAPVLIIFFEARRGNKSQDAKKLLYTALTRLRKGAYNTDCLISVVCTDPQFSDYGKTWEKEILW